MMRADSTHRTPSTPQQAGSPVPAGTPAVLALRTGEGERGTPPPRHQPAAGSPDALATRSGAPTGAWARGAAHRSDASPGRSRRGRQARTLWLLALICAAALSVCWAFSSDSARAGTIAVVSCKDPATGASEPTEGWTPSWSTEAFPYAGNVDDCPSGGNLESYVGDQVTQPGSSGPVWEYVPPAGDSIVGGRVSAAFSIPGAPWPYSGATALAAPKLLFDAADIVGGPAGGAVGSSEGVYSLSGHTGGDIWLYAFCEPPGSPCPAGDSHAWYWSLGEIRWADIELSNEAAPEASGLSGGLADPAQPVSGTRHLDFTAIDRGQSASGIYLVTATLDGRQVYRAVPNANGGMCAPVGERIPGVMEFASAHPCRASVSVSVPLDTAAVADGSHRLKVTVADAAGNEATVYDATITTHNAPTLVTPPSVSGAARVGSTLTGTQAQFSAPEGAGPVSILGSRWLRCSGASGTGCTPISGAVGSSCTPTASDVGYSLIYQSVAADSDGQTSADSQPTVPVTTPAAPAAPAGSAPATTSVPATTGGLSVSTVTNASANATVDGVPTMHMRAPAPRMRGNGAPWRVDLAIRPRRVHRGSTITLTGRVRTGPRPPHGKLVYLQARALGRAARRARRLHGAPALRRGGGWVTFMVLRTRPNGSFRARYTFRRGGCHVYQLRAVAPQEGGYRDATGRSRALTVREGPRR